MARYITLLKDIQSPNGKRWCIAEAHIVSDEVADFLVRDGSAKYEIEDLGQAIKEVTKTTKKKNGKAK